MSEAGQSMRKRTRLAEMRVRRGVRRDVRQADLAARVGVDTRTLRKLEQGRMVDPGNNLLVNCAIALRCELDDLLEDEHRTWLALDKRTGRNPPDPNELWGPGANRERVVAPESAVVVRPRDERSSDIRKPS